MPSRFVTVGCTSSPSSLGIPCRPSWGWAVPPSCFMESEVVEMPRAHIHMISYGDCNGLNGTPPNQWISRLLLPEAELRGRPLFKCTHPFIRYNGITHAKDVGICILYVLSMVAWNSRSRSTHMRTECDAWKTGPHV